MPETHKKRLQDVVDYFGGEKHMAAHFDVTTVAVDKWIEADALPPARAIEVERLTEGEFKAVNLV